MPEAGRWNRRGIGHRGRENMAATNTYDAIIVGSGITGGWAARRRGDLGEAARRRLGADVAGEAAVGADRKLALAQAALEHVVKAVASRMIVVHEGRSGAWARGTRVRRKGRFVERRARERQGDRSRGQRRKGEPERSGL